MFDQFLFYGETADIFKSYRSIVMDSLNMEKVRGKRKAALSELERLLGKQYMIDHEWAY